MRACPVQAFTAEVDDWLRAFVLTHETRVVGFGSVMWERVGWLGPAGFAGEYVKDIEAMRHLRDVYNALVSEQQGHAPRPRTRPGRTRRARHRG